MVLDELPVLFRDRISSLVSALLLYRVLINRDKSTALCTVFLVRCFGNVITIKKSCSQSQFKPAAPVMQSAMRSSPTV